ncbi:MFS transporter [Gordonia sp. HY285]|uniref:MFS transporter n=1 Tax=Gordonia liuliyuniae TaxID=2911517 RepID=UPI001F009A91|nr:MFS transporter [Gordonia liuliyuniae]MCF8611762.1 MFS transporter [Gordonia liuliyuniae]
MASWSELAAREHRASVIVLAGGVALYAINVYLTTSLLPNAVVDIGGEELYSWTMTVFLVASVISSMLVSRVLSRFGARWSYVAGFVGFAAGTVVAGAAPTMVVMLVGRGVQGFAGGILVGLGFAVVRTVLPARLWQRSIALMSAMWGVGNVIGPIVGGFFAQIGAWRAAFALLAVIAVALVALTFRALPAGAGEASADAVPWGSLVLLTGAAAAVSIASIVDGAATVILLVVALLAGVVFVWYERGAANRVLPEMTYRGRSPLRWIYLGIIVLAMVSTVEMFIPLFGQRIGGLGPLAAGLLGAAISWGWTVGTLSSSGAETDRMRRVVRVAGPLILAAGLAAYGLLQVNDPSTWVIVGWYVTLLFAGTGIGMAISHWFTAGMRVSTDDAEAAQASAGLNTSQLIANAFGSAIAGVLVSLGGPDVVGSARVLTFGFAALALVGVVVAFREFAAAKSWRVEPARAAHDVRL